MLPRTSMLLRAAIATIILTTVAAAETSTSSAVLRFSDGSTVDGGSSTLVRSADGVTGVFLTTIEANETATIWWVIFNKPQHCTGGVCDDDDVLPPPGNTAAGVSVLYATGREADAYGKAEYGAKLLVGDMTNVLFGPGLQDVKNAEIHMVVRSHGPAVPGLVQDQISTFDGGCPEGGCTDIQFSMHRPQRDETAERTARVETLVERIAERLSIRP